METLCAFIVEVGKCFTKFMFSQFSTLKNFHKNIQTLEKELQKLTFRKDDITEDIEIETIEGKYPTRQVIEWLKKVEEIKCKAQPLLEAAHNDASDGQGCILDSNIRQRYQLSKSAAKKYDEVKQLINEACDLPPLLYDRKLRDVPVEHIPAPFLVGQKAQEKLKQLMEFFVDNGIKRIAVYGMGGSGKTTLVKTLNNQLKSSASRFFDMVIWVPVSNDLDMKKVQSRVAERLNLTLNAEESMACGACRLHRALKSRKRFLFILDDVWEKIDLDIVGIPQGDDDQANCKILLTTRSLSVCREMMTDKEIKMELLNEEEAWNLFAQKAGTVVESEDINPLARDISRECGGLPLEIETMGKSMRDKTMIQLWKNALWQLKHSTPHYGSFDKVYLRLELSYNSLPSKIFKWCFLYCSLYPENFLINTRELINCWIAEGLIVGHQTLEESFNDGIAKLEYLKDSCMLEQGEGLGTVKMHSVLREVAMWISSNEKETGFFSSTLQGMQEKLDKSFRRVSFMNKSVTSLPCRLLGCSNLTVLFLQCNPLNKIPDGFFQKVRAIRFLNLSSTQIASLPSSLLQLRELHTLLLRDCSFLENLPQLGDLHKLQVFDLYGTRIRELPKDMGELIHLRDLNLSHTHHLESIIAGSISGLSSLEVLDMSFSAYKWDVKCNVEGAAFDELLSLQRLSVLHIRLDTVDCVALDSAGSWFGRLKEFTIRVSARSCDSSYLPTQHDEKRVILRGVDLLKRGLEGLLYSASALDLVSCGGISSFSDIVADCGLPNLKSLAISNCDCITSLLIGERTFRTTLPNVEHLTLHRLNNLETMLDRVVPRGCLGRLKTIKVVGCGRLKNLISFSLLRLVQNVEEIKVSDCRRMKQIISQINFYETLPKLKTIELEDMDSLTTICSRAVEWSALERIEVSNCLKLEKLPLRACDALTVKEIRGDLNWWNILRWGDDRDKTSLQQRFQAYADNTMLAREE